jgi:hypothetical protein
MATRVLGPTGSKRRKRFLLVPALLVVATALIVVASASGVLTGSPSKFESGNDPSTGLGNEVVNTSGNTDWISVVTTATNTPYVHLSDAAASTSDDSFTPGQKQDTTCPSIEGHKNSPKDDFTDVASYNEQAANQGDVYLYGATLRYAANGNASENIELKQGTNGLCPGSTTLYARTAGDKLLAIDYLGGGNAPQFHLLTWVTTGACNVTNDTAPCWGATVTTLPPAIAEGGVSTTNFTAAQNPISGAAVVAGQFAEFGVNLTDAGILPVSGCSAFAQTVWESRASGSSFVSSTKDVSIENHTISNCAGVSVTKTGSDGGSQAGAVFTLYTGSDTSGTVVGTCTIQADGTCDPAAFTGLTPGSYTIDETTVPAGYDPDPDLPYTFTLAANQSLALAFEDVAQLGAIEISKTSSKTAASPLEGATFSITGPNSYSNSVTTGADGTVCVDGLPFGTYSVTETDPPAGYSIDDSSAHDVTVDANSTCGDGNEATFAATDTPLTDISASATSEASGGTQSRVTCIDADGNDVGNSPQPSASTFADPAQVDALALEPGTYTCTIIIDP